MEHKITAIVVIAICFIIGLFFFFFTVPYGAKDSKPTSKNLSQYLTDSEKIAMVHSLKTVDGDRFLEMDYTLDYKLDEMIEFSADSYEKMTEFMVTRLLDVMPDHPMTIGYSSGCSAFAVPDPEGKNKFFGRNYDFCHVENGTEVPITAIMVKINPKNGGKKSINMIDSYWLGYPKGFYNDGKSDLSMLMGAPYSVLDGMNEDGFAMCVLHLGGNPTAQADPAKKTVWCNVLIRMLLDKASNVDEAIELAKSVNINMVNPALGNDHFFIADASGNYAILEYTFDEGEPDPMNAVPNNLLVLTGDEFSYVTNFYVDPKLADNADLGGKATRGMNRYQILEGTLNLHAYKLTAEQGRDLLKAVSHDANPAENTSHTQWSALYNLSRKTMDISILQDFRRKFTYRIN